MGTASCYLKPTNNAPLNKFGYSVAIHGDRIVVGVPGESYNGNKIIAGSDPIRRM